MAVAVEAATILMAVEPEEAPQEAMVEMQQMVLQLMVVEVEHNLSEEQAEVPIRDIPGV